MDEPDITGITWEWVATVNPVERISVPDPSRYTLLLQEDGGASVRIDCNRGSGGYTLSPGRLSFGPIVSTRRTPSTSTSSTSP